MYNEVGKMEQICHVFLRRWVKLALEFVVLDNLRKIRLLPRSGQELLSAKCSFYYWTW
jgi:hypothetical protein